MTWDAEWRWGDKDMEDKRFETSISRRKWMGLAALGGLGSASLKGLEAGTEASTSDHRVTLRAGDLEAMVVDNHDGLAGEEQKKRRAAIPELPGKLGSLSCTVPFEERFNATTGFHGSSTGTQPIRFPPRHRASIVSSSSTRSAGPLSLGGRTSIGFRRSLLGSSGSLTTRHIWKSTPVRIGESRSKPRIVWRPPTSLI